MKHQRHCRESDCGLCICTNIRLYDAITKAVLATARRCAKIATTVMEEPESPHEIGWQESAERIHDAILNEFQLSTPESDSTASSTQPEQENSDE